MFKSKLTKTLSKLSKIMKDLEDGVIENNASIDKNDEAVREIQSGSRGLKNENRRADYLLTMLSGNKS